MKPPRLDLGHPPDSPARRGERIRFTGRDMEVCARCGATRWEHERGVRTALGLRRDHEFVARP